MEILHIMYIGNGNIIRNVVSKDQYERNYKPKGWVIDTEYVEPAEDPNIPELKTATKIKNYLKMRKVTDLQFNDGLFKKE